MTGRARTVGELEIVRSALISDESRTAGLAFRPYPTDVIISPFSKCGTTWLQQIVHGLRTSGDLEFDDISVVVPWIEAALDAGIDLDAPQVASPRAFKSHLGWDEVPKPARHLVSVRDPQDAMLSLYRFFEGWLFEPGTIDVPTFAREVFLAHRGYWRHLVSWWRHRDDPDVLVVAYEHMRRDLAGHVALIAAFAGIDTEPDRLAIATEQASLASMTEHADKYEERLVVQRSMEVSHLPPPTSAAKVQQVTSGQLRDQVSAATVDAIGTAWQETMTAEFGLADYAALLAALSVGE